MDDTVSPYTRIRKPRKETVNPWFHLSELVPYEVRNLRSFPYNADRSQRWCYSCAKFRNLQEFHRGGDGRCKACKKAALSRDEKRDQNYRKNYGITLADYNRLLEAQGGRCAVCRQRETALDPRTGLVKNLCVDHDHDTNQVRALLCSYCNTALGHLKESQWRTKALLKYIQKIHPPIAKDMPHQLALFGNEQ